MTAEQKAWIDGASHEELFRKWRFALVGDPLLQGDAGKYYAEVFFKMREKVGAAEHTRISKKIGWDPPSS